MAWSKPTIIVLASLTLDEKSIGRGSADQEHERTIAVYDLIENNYFALNGQSTQVLMH